ncbi:MAG: ribosomal RNA small subunit methyltransferase A [Polyangiaceae bacterium]|nr:ribosomal RNA small subunit methyltransferase A [Polyangiaceae bacterium]
MLLSHGLRPKRSFGQNFLADDHLAARIAELAVPTPAGTAIEIGAGLGAFTRPLLERAQCVIAIERDRDMCRVLRNDLEQQLLSRRLVLLEADAKSISVSELAAGRPAPHVLTGNLPYQISGPILRLAVAAADAVVRVVFLVQLEVAERVVALPATKEYGALSVFLQARFEAHRLLRVRRGAFFPQPSVDSAVISLEPRATPLARETRAFRELVTAAFAQRRKKLRNAWQGLLGLDADALAHAAREAGVDLDARGETLSPQQFAGMEREVSR